MKDVANSSFKSIIRWMNKAKPVKRMRGGHFNLKSSDVLRFPAGAIEEARKACATVYGVGRGAVSKIVGSNVVVFCTR